MSSFASTSRALVTVALLLTLAACGAERGDRTASGAAIGAGSGAAIGALFGGVGAIPGALIGAGVGAGTGAVTDKEDIYLGEPAWRNNDLRG